MKLGGGYLIDWAAVLGFLAGGGLSAALAGTKYAAYGPCIIAGAALLRVAFNPTGAPAKSVLADAPVVTPQGLPVGTNVSTSSTLPISAPQKGSF